MNFYGKDKQEFDREFAGMEAELTLRMEDAMEAVFASILKQQIGRSP